MNPEPNNNFKDEAERMARLTALFKNAAKQKKKSNFTAILTAVGIFITLFSPMFVYLVWAHGFVLSTLWAWFLVPLGMPVIKTVYACGIIAIIRLVTYDVNTFCTGGNTEEKSQSDHIIRLVGIALVPWCSLLFGYIIHLFM